MDLHGIHIFLDGFLHFRTTKFFTFNERHKFWTAKAKHFNTGVKTLDFPLMAPVETVKSVAKSRLYCYG